MKGKQSTDPSSKFLRILEVLWLIVAIIAGIVGVSRMMSGQNWGNYLYIMLFTGGVAIFMYVFKKRNRHFMENYYAEKEAEKKP
jgi:archaellum biogenesis protein FlaJ (TadC family)